MKNKKEKINLLILILSNIFSLILIIISIIIFNRLIFIIDLMIYVLSILALFLLQIDIFSVKYGVWKFIHLLIPIMFCCMSSQYQPMETSSIIFISLIVTLVLETVFLLRFKEQIMFSPILIASIWCLLSFFTCESIINLSNVIFDDSEKIVYQCEIQSIEYAKGDKAYLSVQSYADANNNIDIIVTEDLAKMLSIGDEIPLEVGNGYWNIEYFCIQQNQK